MAIAEKPTVYKIRADLSPASRAETRIAECRLHSLCAAEIETVAFNTKLYAGNGDDIPMAVLETERLILRWLSVDDEDFIPNLLNQPSFIQFIGDRGVKNLSDARLYIESKFVESYRHFGFGLYLVGLKEDKTPIGICGFVKRDTLPDADIGFAFLPQYWSQGYAFESARAMFDYGRNVLGFKRILAITTRDNESSCKLLAKVGLKFERMIRFSNEEDEIKLYSSDV